MCKACMQLAIERASCKFNCCIEHLCTLNDAFEVAIRLGLCETMKAVQLVVDHFGLARLDATYCRSLHL
jgi:hypothetical protein